MQHAKTVGRQCKQAKSKVTKKIDQIQEAKATWQRKGAGEMNQSNHSGGKTGIYRKQNQHQTEHRLHNKN